MVYLTKGLGSLCEECGAEGLERVALSRRSYHMLTSKKGNLRINITLVAKCSRLDLRFSRSPARDILTEKVSMSSGGWTNLVVVINQPFTSFRRHWQMLCND